MSSASSSRRSLPARLTPPPHAWAPVVAVLMTAVVAGAARVMIGLRGRRGHVGLVDDGGSAYAPDPLTGDPASVEAADVAPV
jgi:hypothetical protein